MSPSRRRGHPLLDSLHGTSESGMGRGPRINRTFCPQFGRRRSRPDRPVWPPEHRQTLETAPHRPTSPRGRESLLAGMQRRRACRTRDPNCSQWTIFLLRSLSGRVDPQPQGSQDLLPGRGPTSWAEARPPTSRNRHRQSPRDFRERESSRDSSPTQSM